MTENRLVMVSEWMKRGNIVDFVKADVNSDRLGLVCFPCQIYLFWSLT